MSEVIPAEAVEAAANHLYPGWETSPADWKDHFRRKAAEALETAAPHMLAGLRAELVNLAKDFDAAEGGTLAYISPNGLRKNAHDQLMYIAENCLGEQPHD
jgi:hypothetical protein